MTNYDTDACSISQRMAVPCIYELDIMLCSYGIFSAMVFFLLRLEVQKIDLHTSIHPRVRCANSFQRATLVDDFGISAEIYGALDLPAGQRQKIKNSLQLIAIIDLSRIHTDINTGSIIGSIPGSILLFHCSLYYTRCIPSILLILQY